MVQDEIKDLDYSYYWSSFIRFQFIFATNLSFLLPINQFSFQRIIFVANESERKIAEESKQRVVAMFPDQTVVTPILDASTFYPIKGDESYHQDFYKNSPIRYNAYRWNCGRDQRLRYIWGDKATHWVRQSRQGTLCLECPLSVPANQTRTAGPVPGSCRDRRRTCSDDARPTSIDPHAKSLKWPAARSIFPGPRSEQTLNSALFVKVDKFHTHSWRMIFIDWRGQWSCKNKEQKGACNCLSIWLLINYLVL